MKPVRTVSSYILLVGLMGLSIVGGIVAYQIYSASIKNQTTPEQATSIKPLDGVIDQSTVDSLKKRTVYSDIQMGLILNGTPTPVLAVTSTASAGVATASATTQ
jgi:hypothetical protein